MMKLSSRPRDTCDKLEFNLYILVFIDEAGNAGMIF